MDGRENKGFGFDRSTGSGFPLRQYGSQAQGETGGDDSPFYKSAAPTVSLPKGGGAIKAIDEKFSVNAVNGTAGLAIPLPLTPGRGGFTPTLSLQYDSPETFLDPWNNETTVSYGSNGYWLLPESVTDAKNNVSTIEAYDWHTLQPLRMKDVNDNISEISYDALGLAVAMAVKSKDDGTEGDTLDGLDIDSANDLQLQEDFWNDPKENASDLLQGATWRCVYDLESTPVAVAMIGREEHHYQSLGLPVKTLMQFIYSDGLGREIMQKVQCEPTASNDYKEWIGTGRTIYNNKGKPVMQYEPYFSAAHTCDTAEQAAADGVSPQMHYDPLGRLYRTDLPDGSYSQTKWTAWQQSIYDNNDTVLDSAWYAARIGGAMGAEEKDAALKAAAHADTPTIMHLDTLVRAFYSIQYCTPLNSPPLEGCPPGGVVHSYETLDIQNNRLSVVDGRGLTPLQYRYNMLQAPCLQTSIDSGTQRTLLDVAGQPLYAWDADDRETGIEYDELRRTLKQITDGKELEYYVYGEGQINAKEKNLRGQLYQHYDGSGFQQMNVFDFKGNPLETEHQLLEDATISDADWSINPALNAEIFTSAITYDALSRSITQTDPGGNVHEFTYDKGGALKTVKLNTDAYVNDIHYNEKGQRSAIWYGNGTKASYTYDEQTFRLRRLLTVNLNNNEILQDLNYWYDPVGNISEIQDDAQQTLFFNNSVVSPTQKYVYDALYRLIESKGRELIGTADFGTEDNWNDNSWKTNHKGDGNAVQNYTQKYTYDEVGNILELQHIAGTGCYTRNYVIDTNSNKLLSTVVGSNTYTYAYGVRGNMIEMPHLSAMNWNTQNELKSISKGSEPTYYQYRCGERIRKHTVKGNVKEERIYLGSYEIYRRYVNSVLDIERTTVHISDDTGRIAMLEKRSIGTDSSPAELTRYIYSNHLQSASLELDGSGEIISYEEYHPYGTTSYQAMNASINAVAKRYRYTGKERDEESGLYYCQARFYICWLGRWGSSDPINSENYNLQMGYGFEKNKERNYTELTASPYEYCYDSPVNYTDETGEQPPTTKKPTTSKRDEYFDMYGKYDAYVTGKLENKTSSNNLVRVYLAMGKSYKLSELDYSSSGTLKSVSKIIAHYASVMGYRGRYGVKDMKNPNTIAHHNPRTGNVYINIKALQDDKLDNIYDLMSVIQHEADPKFGHKEEDKSKKYTFLQHAEVYMQQSSTDIFSKTTEGFRASTAIEYAERIWNAYKEQEIDIIEIDNYINQYNKQNTGKVNIDYKFYLGTGNIDIKVSVNGVKRQAVPAKKLEKPED